MYPDGGFLFFFLVDEEGRRLPLDEEPLEDASLLGLLPLLVMWPIVESSLSS
jgi:hypothetical protein